MLLKHTKRQGTPATILIVAPRRRSVRDRLAELSRELSILAGAAFNLLVPGTRYYAVFEPHNRETIAGATK